MIRVNFSKLLAKQPIKSLIEGLVQELATSICITDAQNKILWGEFNQHSPYQYPITVNETVIGYIYGETKVQIIAQILNYLVQQEFQKKNLAIETLDKYEEINFLYDISSKMSTSLTLEEIIHVVIEETKNLLDFSQISFMLLDQKKGELEIFSKQQGKVIKTQGTIRSIEGYVLQSGKEEIINDVNEDPRYIYEGTMIRSLICVPLKVCNETIGVIKVSHTQPSNYTTKDLKLFTALTSQAAAAIQTAQYYNKLKDYSETLEQKVAERTQELEQANQELQKANDKLEYLAIIDGLTQVHNRRYFNQYLVQEWRRLMRERQSLSLILCDVDYFKLFNDHYLHQAGDDCLQKIAQVMQDVVKRPADLVARFGGEEFAIILSNTNELGAARVAQKIRLGVEQLKIPHALSQCSEYVTLSLGIATTIPTPDISSERLILAADKALYQAKNMGRNRYCLYAFRPKQF